MEPDKKDSGEERVMGWEETCRYEERKSRLSQRLKPDSSELRAAFCTMLVFICVFFLSLWGIAEAGNESSGGFLGVEINTTVILLAILFEFLDASAGMGYGTAMTPLLLVLGFEPIQIVPAIMIQQATAGLTGAYLHRKFGNVTWSLRPMSETTKLWLLIAGTGSLAVVFSITSVYGVLKLASGYIRIYVTVLLVLMGVISLLNAGRIKKYRPGWMVFFGALAGFNKGIGGGGYGPVVTIGGLLSGVPVKTMMAITSLSEGTVCVVSIIVWWVLRRAGVEFDYSLLPSMLLGSAFAAIAAPYAVKVVHSSFWRWFVPVYSCVLALYSVYKLAAH